MTPLQKAWRQRKIDFYIFFIPFCGGCILFMKIFFRYRIRELETLREEYRELTRDRRPLLICSNHLTYMDPILLIYAFANHWRYVADFRLLTWNIPAADYKKNPFFRSVCYASKCLFIDRHGTREHHTEVLSVARQLLQQGEILTLFPEGRRSKTGRFDKGKLAFGVGRVVVELPECRVLCVYLRADDQRGKAGFPTRKAQFTVDRKLLVFQGDPSLLGSAKREAGMVITRKIASVIEGMERDYFGEPTTAAAQANPGLQAEIPAAMPAGSIARDSSAQPG